MSELVCGWVHGCMCSGIVGVCVDGCVRGWARGWVRACVDACVGGCGGGWVSTYLTP